MKVAKLVLNLFLVVALIAAAYIVYGSLTKKTAPQETTPQADAQPAPAFTVYDYDGGEVKLSDFAGKPTVINFWASWCGNCVDEMPHFDKYYSEMGGDINFVMVNMTDGSVETLDKAKAFIAEQGYTFPVYFDTSESAASAYRIRGIPLTYFLDKDLNIVAYQLGAMDEATLKGYLDKLS